MMRVGRVAFLTFLLSAVLGASAVAGGVSPQKLVNAGWVCVPIEGQVHCFLPGDFPGFDSAGPSITVRVFDTADPQAAEADFLGTELLIRADLFAGQPCPQDGGSYAGLNLFGDTEIDYYACHHYDTSP